MSVVTATIKINDEELASIYRLVGIDINYEVNRIPYAQLLLIEGSAADRKFPISNDHFNPGDEVEILLRIEGRERESNSVFKGLVVQHALESDGLDSVLRIELKSAAYGLTLVRKSIVHQGTDVAIIENLVRESGLNLSLQLAPDIKKENEPKHPEIIQYYSTDWDFMLSRAETQNLLVVVQDREISLKRPVKNPDDGTGNKHNLDYGIDQVFKFEMEVDVGHSYGKVMSAGWDQTKQKMRDASPADGAFTIKQGMLTAEKDIEEVAKKFGAKTLSLTSTAPLGAEEAKKWATSRQSRSRMSMLRGSITVPGLAGIHLLDELTINGLGKRFSGSTLVTGFRHQVDSKGWLTHIQFGLSAMPFSSSPNIVDTPAAGLLPAVKALQPGIVQALKKDTEGQFRIQVKLPGINTGNNILWARLAMPDAGAGRGLVFLPEPGDEVVLGFMNDDPRQPLVLGSFYSNNNQPPKAWEKWAQDKFDAAVVGVKGMISKTGLSLIFDDNQETLWLQSKKQSIMLNQKKGKVQVKDKHGNEIILDDKGITLKAKQDGDVTIEGQNIKLNATTKVSINGANIEFQ